MRTEGERFEASVRRSRSVVRHKARCLAVMYLWTFTKRGKFSSRDDLWLAWREFERMALKRFGARWRYVAVPELHSDGVTWHLHVAVAEWFDVSALRVLWYRALGGTGAEQGDATPGSVNAKDFRRRGGARRIWSYIAKYVGKGVSSSEPFRRSFSTSKGIRPLGVSVLHATWKCDLWFALEALSAELRGRFRVIGLWRAKILDGVSVGWFECAQ